MRGKALILVKRWCFYGITPAHAGKRSGVCLSALPCGDHPRTCGEKETEPGTGWCRLGSPPHMRGKVDTYFFFVPARRITPAHAGKSEKNSVIVWPLWDHPRTCGEKQVPRMERPRSKGSPPHMRGKGQSAQQGGKQTRITPAHAGKRLRNLQSAVWTWDHPRTCGEKMLFAVFTLPWLGSPPHMRGKDGLSQVVDGCTWDHPRTCGEKRPPTPQ